MNTAPESLFIIWKNGRRAALPCSASVIRRQIETGELSPDTLATPEGSDEWKPLRAWLAPVSNCGQVDRNSPAAAPVPVHIATENPFGFLAAPIPGRAAGKLSAVGILGVALGVLCVPVVMLTPWAALGVLLGVGSWLWARR